MPNWVEQGLHVVGSKVNLDQFIRKGFVRRSKDQFRRPAVSAAALPAEARRAEDVFTRLNIVELDLLYMSNERAASVLTEKHVTGAPEIIIEIASPSTRKRDETIKRRLYERSGVSEYWVVDPELDVVRVYRSEDGRFRRPEELSREAADVLTTTVLSGLEIPLERVFA